MWTIIFLVTTAVFAVKWFIAFTEEKQKGA